MTVTVGDGCALFFLCARALRKLMDEPSPSVTRECGTRTQPIFVRATFSATARQ